MFCPQCGFEYTQKTNYCKRCGAGLSYPDQAPVIQPPSLKITGIFLVIAAFGLFGLMEVYKIYMKMLYAGVRGAPLFVPFVLGIALIGAILEPQPHARIAAPNDPVLNVVERPSVAEHTTRQMAGAYREPQARE